jgi:hypothetical protein
MKLEIKIIENHFVPYKVIVEKTKQILPNLEKKYKNFITPRETWKESGDIENFTFSFSMQEMSGSSVEGVVHINRNTITLDGTITISSFPEKIRFLFLQGRRQKRMLKREIKKLNKLLNNYFFKTSKH